MIILLRKIKKIKGIKETKNMRIIFLRKGTYESRYFVSTKSIKLKSSQVIAVTAAAPRMPYLGINIRLNIKLNMEAAIKFINIHLDFPFIDKRLLEIGIMVAATKFPIAKILKEFCPVR